ncbi:hypothetical protein GGX14DRAFT_397571 [Mycena pura]|uniref:Uncharacterized protein n=1 Tax=Mycena pura TaxID=153505 RepID=A0AAD6YCC7_9AGAR|nr:hypothetical protein GGX14DRAFT_397571 [Mycena pura]
MSQVFIGVHIPMSMTPCLSSLNNPPRWSLPTTPDTAGHLKVEMMEWWISLVVSTPRSRCRGMHPVHKGQQKGGMREQHSLFPHVKIVSKPLSQDTTQKCREVSGHQRSLHSGHYRSHLWEDHIKVLPDTFKPGYRVSDWHAAFPAQAEKGLKELIKAALEEDSDDDNKPEWQRRWATKSGPSMRQGSGSGGAGRRQARVSDHGRCTGQRRRRASKPTPRMLPRRAGGGAAQGSPVLQRGSVVAARRRQQASKASVCADALPCEHTRAALQRSCGDGGNVGPWCGTGVATRQRSCSAAAATGVESEGPLPRALHRQRASKASACGAALLPGAAAGGVAPPEHFKRQA